MGWRMRTTTPVVDTRPSFFVFRPILRASIVANILRKKFGPGDEAIALLAIISMPLDHSIIIIVLFLCDASS